MADAGLGLPAAFLILGDARRFFEEDPQFLGLGLDEPRDHALLDDGVAARPQAGTQENIGNIPAPAAGAVQ